MKTLEEIASFITRGFSYNGSEKSTVGGEYVFMTLNSIKEGGGFKREFSYVTSDRIKEKDFVLKDDIIIANTEQTKTGTLLGCPALVEFPKSYKGSKGVFSHHITKVIPNPGTDKSFLYYNLIFNQKNAVKYSTGSVIWALDVKNWSKNEKIMLPPIREQRFIAKVLTDLDSKIELNNQMNATLESMAQAIFKHWFIDFEFPTENGKPYKSSGGKMVDSELGKIPGGWKLGVLRDLAEINSGKRPYDKSNIYTEEFSVELLGASSVMGYVKEALYTEPIIVIGRVGTHGIVQRINTPSWPSDNTLVIRSRYYEYVFQCLKRIDYNSLNIGSTQPLITQTQIKNQEILIPEKRILAAFESLLSRLYNEVEFNSNEITNLSSIRDSLLPKLMSGRIRVPIVVAK